MLFDFTQVLNQQVGKAQKAEIEFNKTRIKDLSEKALF